MKKNTILKMLKMASIEVDKYKKTKNELWLYQASEKTWTAYILMIEGLSGKNLRSRKEIDNESWALINDNKLLSNVYEKANILHVYHYEGRLSTVFVLRNIDFVKRKIKEIIK